MPTFYKFSMIMADRIEEKYIYGSIRWNWNFIKTSQRDGFEQETRQTFF